MIVENIKRTSGWTILASLEGLLKTFSGVFVKGLGQLASHTFTDRNLRTDSHLYAVSLMEATRLSAGALGCIIGKHSLLVSRRVLMFCAGFALVAFSMSMLILWGYEDPRADMAVASLISLSSIIYAIFLDWLFFKERIATQQMLGCGLFMVAGYCFLGFPNFQSLLDNSPWLWLFILNSILMAVNEAIGRALGTVQISQPNPFQLSFWIGAFGVVLFTGALVFRGGLDLIKFFPLEGYRVALGNGVLISIILAFRVFSYRLGGSILQKKFVTHLVALLSAIPIGIVFHGEEFYWGKLFGVPVALLGYLYLIKKPTVRVPSLAKPLN